MPSGWCDSSASWMYWMKNTCTTRLWKAQTGQCFPFSSSLSTSGVMRGCGRLTDLSWHYCWSYPPSHTFPFGYQLGLLPGEECSPEHSASAFQSNLEISSWSSSSTGSGLLSTIAVAESSGDSTGETRIGIMRGEPGWRWSLGMSGFAQSIAASGLAEESSPVSGVTSFGSGATGASSRSNCRAAAATAASASAFNQELQVWSRESTGAKSSAAPSNLWARLPTRPTLRIDVIVVRWAILPAL